MEDILSLQLYIQRMFLSANETQNLSSACLQVVSTNEFGPRALKTLNPVGILMRLTKLSVMIP